MKEKLLKKLEELELRPVDALNILLLIMTIIIVIIMVIDLSMTKRSMKRELSELRAALGIEQETIPDNADAAQLESTEISDNSVLETISGFKMTDNQIIDEGNLREEAAVQETTVQANSLDQNDKLDKIMAYFSPRRL